MLRVQVPSLALYCLILQGRFYGYSQRDLMIVYTLSKPLDCGKVCQDMQKLIDSHNQTDPESDKVLIITIKNIVDEQTAIPKLPYHPE